MNDCFYSFIGCEKYCDTCMNYISVNGEDGREKYEKYSKEVNETLQPLVQKYLSEIE